MLRDWTYSEKIHLLSPEAERFFTRLIMKADDFGRYYANPMLLRGALFPLHSRLKDDKIKSWLDECSAADLIHLYEVGGKRFVEIKGFDQKLKVRRSKYPPSDEQRQSEMIEGYVYLIGTDYSRPVKIGYSVNPWSRLKEITINHPEKLELLTTIRGSMQLESEIHRILKLLRVKNEWFLLTKEIADCFTRFSNHEIDKETFLVEIRSISSGLRSSPEEEREREEEREGEEEVSPAFWDKEEKKKRPLTECLGLALKDSGWITKNKTSERELILFNDYLEGTGETEKTILDYKKHFHNLKAKAPDKFKKNGIDLSKTIKALNG